MSQLNRPAGLPLRTIRVTHPGGGNASLERARVRVTTPITVTDSHIDIRVERVQSDAVYRLFVFSPQMLSLTVTPLPGDTVASIAAAFVAAYNAAPIADTAAIDLGGGVYRIDITSSGILGVLLFSLRAGDPVTEFPGDPLQTIDNAVYTFRTNGAVQAVTAPVGTTAAQIADKFAGGGPLYEGTQLLQPVGYTDLLDGSFELSLIDGADYPFELEVSSTMSITQRALYANGPDAGRCALAAMAAQPGRQYLAIHNHGAGTVYVNFGASASTGDIPVTAGASRVWERPPREAIHLHAASASALAIEAA